MSFQRTLYDQCAYAHRVRESMGPGMYHLEKPRDDTGPVGGTVRPDDFIMLQGYGRGVCPQGTNVEAESDLLGYTQRVSRRPEDGVRPAPTADVCVNKSAAPARRDYTPTEATRLSNPSCTLRGSGANRFHPLCSNPQEWCKIQSRVPLGTSSRILVKDNHVACVSDVGAQRMDAAHRVPGAAGDAWRPEDSMYAFRPSQQIPATWFDEGFVGASSVQTGYPG